jgi:hypothetical protein
MTTTTSKQKKIASTLLIGSSTDSVARGAGYARNRAIELYHLEDSDYKALHFSVCWTVMIPCTDIGWQNKL